MVLCRHCGARSSLPDVFHKLVQETLQDLRKPRKGLKRKVRAVLRARPTALEIALFILKKSAFHNNEKQSLTSLSGTVTILNLRERLPLLIGNDRREHDIA